MGLPGGTDGKEFACNAGDLNSIPGSGRSPEEWNGNPLQYSCLENSMDRGAWRATVHEVVKSWTRLSKQHTHQPICLLEVRLSGFIHVLFSYFFCIKLPQVRCLKATHEIFVGLTRLKSLSYFFQFYLILRTGATTSKFFN